MKTLKIRSSGAIGAIIKARRRGLGISQEKLAEILNVTYQQVQRYENGINRLNVENIQVIANTLKVPVSYFFEPERITDDLTPEERKLLKYFRDTKEPSSRKIIIQVARLAGRK